MTRMDYFTHYSNDLALILEQAGQLEHRAFTPALLNAARTAAVRNKAVSVLSSGDPFGPTGYTVELDDNPDCAHPTGFIRAATVWGDGTVEIYGHVRDVARAEQRAKAAWRGARA